jgi:hypothetical protein
MHVKLIPHPSTPVDLIDSFDVLIQRTATSLRLVYSISGRLDQILWPARTSPERRDKLWQHTCFELFMRSKRASSYCELNFSPSTCWAAYEFDDYRAGMTNLACATPPSIDVERKPGCVALRTALDLDALTNHAQDEPRVALAAVIEDREHRKSYWALTHLAAAPDFHHPDAFTLAIPSGVSR